MGLFYVIDENNNVSLEDEEPENFSEHVDALERAKVLAREVPGELILVVKTINFVRCRVGNPEVT